MTTTSASLAVSVALCRAVFDDLLERDLLGLLLSTSHFSSYIRGVQLDDASALAQVQGNIELEKQLHGNILSMFKAIYIAECRAATQEELNQMLDAKLAEACIQVDNDRLDQYANEVESAWRYRRACLDHSSRIDWL